MLLVVGEDALPELFLPARAHATIMGFIFFIFLFDEGHVDAVMGSLWSVLYLWGENFLYFPCLNFLL